MNNKSREHDKTDFLLTGLVYLFYILGACIASFAVSSLIILIVSRIFPTDSLIEGIINAAVYLLGETAVLSVMGFKDGYKNGNFRCKFVLLPFLVAVVPHLLLAVPFSRLSVLFGGVRYLAGLFVYFSSGEYIACFDENYIWYLYCLIAYIVYALFFTTAFCVSNKRGADKRKKDRTELFKDKNT